MMVSGAVTNRRASSNFTKTPHRLDSVKLGVEIGPLAVLVRHFSRLQGPFDSYCRIVPAQPAFRLRRVEGAMEINRLDVAGQRNEAVPKPRGMYSIERLSSLSSAPYHLR